MQPIPLTALADDGLAAARESADGRSSHTLPGDAHRTLRHIVLAFAAGRGLPDHDNPGEATLQVLRGRVRLTTAADGCEAAAGDHLVIPPERHALTAVEDSVVLLTVVPEAARRTT